MDHESNEALEALRLAVESALNYEEVIGRPAVLIGLRTEHAQTLLKLLESKV